MHLEGEKEKTKTSFNGYYSPHFCSVELEKVQGMSALMLNPPFHVVALDIECKIGSMEQHDYYCLYY